MRVAFDRRRHGENTAAKSDGHRETTTGVWVARGSFRRRSCRGRVATGARRDFCVEGEALFLAMESHRIRHAYQFDPLFAVNVPQVDSLPHQIEVVYHYILRNPRVRFLLADDPGAGKTIMAGLLLKELKYRGIIQRILIVVPGHLKDQWLREMEERFSESFAVVDRVVIKAPVVPRGRYRQTREIVACRCHRKLWLGCYGATTGKCVETAVLLPDQRIKSHQPTSSNRRRHDRINTPGFEWKVRRDSTDHCVIASGSRGQSATSSG